VILLALWLLRAGSMVRFSSKSVLVGFLAGLGIEILTSQVEKIMNVSVDTGEWVTDVIELVKSIPDTSAASVVVGITTIVILRLIRQFAPSVPGRLVALVVLGGAVAILDPEGVDLLGEIPSGLPAFSFPTVGLETWVDLFGTAVAIAVLTVAEGLLVAGSAARRHGDQFDANGELFSMGSANLAASVTSGMPIGASASRSAAVESAGSRSQLPALVSAAVVVIVVLFLTDLVAEIPSAVLAALVANRGVATPRTRWRSWHRNVPSASRVWDATIPARSSADSHSRGMSDVCGGRFRFGQKRRRRPGVTAAATTAVLATGLGPGVTAAPTTAALATGLGPGVTAAATAAVRATGAPMTPALPTRPALTGMVMLLR
jgi:MFS superfamily sulfate permease-like transporter